MTKYVCGFLFNHSFDRVVLIRKNRGPRHMAGKANGVGGKIEIGESPRGAMSREFLEETGTFINPLCWMGFHTESYFADTGNKVHYMCAVATDSVLDQCRTAEDEEVLIVDLYRDGDLVVNSILTMYNLAYLLPMAKSWLQNPLDRYFEG